MKCADCDGAARQTSEKTINAGSKVREPGEALCAGCSSRRVLMVRAVDNLPNTLADIRAQRMAVSI
jgi:DNA-directed RNA polymerase subunit RPC12/RpoP